MARLDRSRFTATFGIFQPGSDFEAFDAVVPFRLADYSVLTQRPLDRGWRFVMPPAHLVTLCDDKLALNRRLLETGFAALVPALYDANDIAPYPFVLKPRHGSYGRGIAVVGDERDERAMTPLLHDPRYFRQRYVPGGEEYALHLLIVEGSVRYHRSVHYAMPAGVYVKSADCKPARLDLLAESPLLELFSDLMRSLGYEGLCCINYKIEDGEPRLLEINPRFGGSLCHDINAFLEAYLDCLRPLPGVGPQRSSAPPARLMPSATMRFSKSG